MQYNIIHGGLILADQCFDISKYLALGGATLAISPFTKETSQLSKREVETSQIFMQRLERAIGLIKCYKTLQNTFPISSLKTSQEDNYAKIDSVHSIM